MAQGFDSTSEMWINDPQVCRDADPQWFDKVEHGVFDHFLRQGTKPTQAYPRDLEKRQRYIAFLKAHGSPLADG